MDQEQLSNPRLRAVRSPLHPEPGSDDFFDLTTPEYHAPVPFSELPLYIPGMTTPVVGFDGGINLAALDNHRDEGLLCILLPYLDMTQLDFIELFYRDVITPVATHTVTKEQADKGIQIPLYIPRTRFTDGPVEPVFFRVTRVLGGTEETRRFRLKIDTVAPAGPDPIPSEPWHSNLGAPEPDTDFVDETAAGLGVKVTIPFYPLDINRPANTHRTVRDRIRLSIGGFILNHRITEGEAAGREPIVIWVYAGTWAQIGSGSHVCEYEVVDEVGNYSPGWSPAVLIEVELDDGAEPLLPECYIYEAPADVLDVDEQMGADATIEVSVHRFDYVVGDLIRVRAIGRNAQGASVTTYYEHRVTVTGRNARIPFPFEDFAPLVGGRVQLSYERIRAGVPNRRSHTTIVQVTGTPINISLPAPRVDEAPDGVTLPPESAYVTVRIDEYTGQDPFDLVTLFLVGVYANGSRYYREVYKAAGEGPITFRLANGVNGDIAKLVGGTLRLSYTATNAQGTRPSQDLLLDVGLPQASLPEPFVEQAPPPEYVFDPDQSSGDAHILVRAHTDIQEDDIITLYFEGSASGGSAPPIIFQVLPHWVGRDLPFNVQRQYVLANLNGSALIYYTLTRPGARTRLSHAVVMKVGAMLTLDVPEVLEATKTGPTSAQMNPLHIDQAAVFTIRVRYAPMLYTDDITVFLFGKPGFAIPAIKPKPGDPSLGYVDFYASGRNIAAHLGQVLRVGYSVHRQGALTNSEILDLRVLAFDELTPNPLPFPRINDIAPGGTLNLNTIAGDATAAVAKWPLSAAGDWVWLTCSSAGVDDLNLLTAHPLTSAEAANGLHNLPVPRSWLESIPNNSPIHVKFQATFDGTLDAESIVTFPITTYTVVQRSKLSMEWPFTTGSWHGWSPDGQYRDTNNIANEGVGLGIGSYTDGPYNFSGPVIAYTVQVQANKTYDLSFSLRAIRATGANATNIYLTVSGSAIGSAVNTQRQTIWRTGTGVYTAPVTGSVKLGLHNTISSGDGNDFYIGHVTMKER